MNLNLNTATNAINLRNLKLRLIFEIKYEMVSINIIVIKTLNYFKLFLHTTYLIFLIFCNTAKHNCLKFY